MIKTDNSVTDMDIQDDCQEYTQCNRSMWTFLSDRKLSII